MRHGNAICSMPYWSGPGHFPSDRFLLLLRLREEWWSVHWKSGKDRSCEKGKSKQGDKKSGSGPEAFHFSSSLAAK